MYKSKNSPNKFHQLKGDKNINHKKIMEKDQNMTKSKIFLFLIKQIELSVQEIASIFEQKVKQNNSLNISTRKRSVNYFSKTTPYFTQNLESKKSVITKTKEKTQEDKFLSVSEITKNINKEISKKHKELSPTIRKSSKSLNKSNINKKPQEKLKVKSFTEIDIFTNLKSFQNHKKEIAQLYQKGNFDNFKNTSDSNQEISKNNFREFIDNNRSNKTDLSVISEKDDRNTSISLIDKNRENKIKDFIFSSIKEIKTFSTDLNIKSSIPPKYFNNSLKKSFVEKRRSFYFADKLELQEQLKKNIPNIHHPNLGLIFINKEVIGDKLILPEVDSNLIELDKSESLNIIQNLEISFTHESSKEDPIKLSNCYDVIEQDKFSICINCNSKTQADSITNSSHFKIDSLEINKSNKNYNCHNNQKNVEIEECIELMGIFTNNIAVDKSQIITHAQTDRLNDDHKYHPNTLNNNFCVGLNENASNYTEIEIEDIKQEIENIDKINRKIDSEFEKIKLEGFNESNAILDVHKQNYSLKDKTEKIFLFPNIFEKYLLSTMITMYKWPLLYNLVQKFHIKLIFHVNLKTSW